MNSLIDVAVMVLYGSRLVLKFGTSKGPPSPYPSLHFSSTASRGWHCHSHMQGHTKKLPHTLLVNIEIAIPFRKQSGSIYPKSRPPSLMKSSHVPMTTALSGTESFSRWYRGRPRTSMQWWKRKTGRISTMDHYKVREETGCREEHMTSSDFYEAMREITCLCYIRCLL